MGAKGHAFKHEIDVASRTLGRDGRIRVVIGGTEAKTEAGGVIRYPALADDVDLTDDQISLSRAYVDSETARILHGDVGALRAAESAWGEDSPAACAARSLEEIRLEAVRTREYLGCRANFQARARLEAVLHGKDRNFADPSNLEAHALAVGRRDALGHDDPGLEALAAALPADRRAAWADLARKAVAAADTGEILRLAADAFGTAPPPEGNGESQDESGADPAGTPEGRSGKARGKEGRKETEGRTRGKKDGEDAGGEKSSGDGTEDRSGEESEEESGDAGSEGTSERSEESEGSGGRPSSPPRKESPDSDEGGSAGKSGREGSFGEGPEESEGGAEGGIEGGDDADADHSEALRGISKDAKGGGTRRPERAIDEALDSAKAGSHLGTWDFLRPEDAFRMRRPGDAEWNEEDVDDTRYAQAKASVASDVSAMRVRLPRLVLDKAKERVERRKTSGRLDARAFVSVVTRADPYAFKSKVGAPALDTAVTLLVDLSGSMEGTKAVAARNAVIAFSEALEGLCQRGLAYNVLGFSCGDPWPGGRRRFGGWAGPASASYVAGEPVQMWTFKDWRESLHRSRGSIAAIDSAVGGNNNDAPSVDFACRRLLERQEKRRILFVLSDGSPCCETPSGGPDELNQALKMVVARHSTRIEIVGIGLMTNAVKSFFPRNVVVPGTEGFAPVLLETLGKILVGGRFKGKAAG